MKRAISMFVVSSVVAGPAVAQEWTVINLGVTDHLREFNYGGFSDKWLSGDNGFLAKSVDLQNWTIVNPGVSGDLPSMVRWTSVGFLVGGGAGVVRRSGDAGATWVGANIPDAAHDYSLYSRSGGWANAVGSGGEIYQTRDAGDSWFSVYSGVTPLHDGSGFIGSISRVVGDDGLVLKTTDGGVTWTVQPTGTTDNLYCFLEGGGGFLFAAGENGTIIRSPDGGDTWTRQTTGTTESIRDLRGSAVSASIMFAVGDNGTLLRTTNYGDDWCRIDPQTTEHLHAVFATNSNMFAVAGENGTLLYTETGGGDCDDIVPVQPSPDPGALAPPALVLASPRPNPFGDVTTVSFGVPLALDGVRTQVTVFDVAGRAVRHLVDSSVAVGSYTVAWDGANDAGRSVQSGTYFLRLVSGPLAATERVVVVR